MTLGTLAAMFGAMLVLAAIPGTSVIAVVSRSISAGFSHGLLTVIGIVLGDIIFILIAVFGLSLIADTHSYWFVLVKYLGGAYLVWLGIRLWRVSSKKLDIESIDKPSWFSSFICGLMITLGDQKAIFFYLGFLPAFVDLNQITASDVSLIIAIAIISISSVKLTYAYIADKSKKLFKSSSAIRVINSLAGVVLIITGLVLIAKNLAVG